MTVLLLFRGTLRRGKPDAVSQALGELGVVTERHDPDVRTEMAYGMFDTRGKVRRFALAPARHVLLQ